MVYIFHIFFIQSLAGVALGWCHILAIMDWAAINRVSKDAFFFNMPISLPWSKLLGVKWLEHMATLSVDFWRLFTLPSVETASPTSSQKAEFSEAKHSQSMETAPLPRIAPDTASGLRFGSKTMNTRVLQKWVLLRLQGMLDKEMSFKGKDQHWVRVCGPCSE